MNTFQRLRGSVAWCWFLGMMLLAAGGRSAEPVQTVVDRGSSELLKWQLRDGDRFAIEQQTVTRITTTEGKRYRNVVLRDYEWEVTSASTEELATITIIPQRLRMTYELPPGQFDTDQADSSTEVVGDQRWTSAVADARAWLQSRVSFQVTALGDVEHPSDLTDSPDHLVIANCSPGALGRLTGRPASVGDVWLREAKGCRGAKVNGTTVYRLTDRELIDGKPVLRIEATTIWQNHPDGVAGQGDFGPTIAVSHFDPVGGLYLDHMEVTSGQCESSVPQPDDTVSVRIGSSWRIAKILPSP